jgi:predicted Zn-dependent protease
VSSHGFEDEQVVPVHFFGLQAVQGSGCRESVDGTGQDSSVIEEYQEVVEWADRGPLLPARARAGRWKSAGRCLEFYHHSTTLQGC